MVSREYNESTSTTSDAVVSKSIFEKLLPSVNQIPSIMNQNLQTFRTISGVIQDLSKTLNRFLSSLKILSTSQEHLRSKIEPNKDNNQIQKKEPEQELSDSFVNKTNQI